MKIKLKAALAAGAALTLLAAPASAQNSSAAPQIKMPDNAVNPSGTGNGAVPRVTMPGTASNGGAAGTGGNGAGGATNSASTGGGQGGAAITGSVSGGNGAGGGTGVNVNVGNRGSGSRQTGSGIAARGNIKGTQLSSILGKNVLNSKNVQVGSVSNLVVDKNQLAYAVINVGGGFLGIGDKKIAVPVSKLSLQSNPAVLRTTMTKQQLQKLPAYNPSSYSAYNGGHGGNGRTNGQAAGGSSQ